MGLVKLLKPLREKTKFQACGNPGNLSAGKVWLGLKNVDKTKLTSMKLNIEWARLSTHLILSKG